ncbi:MAG: hypothetical protein ABFS02_11860 [Pseudomonadota bacterium]
MAFGASTHPIDHVGYEVMNLGHIVRFLQDYLRQHWEMLRHGQFKGSALGFLVTVEKALHNKHSDKGD